jgi:hypothetical protein
MRELVGFVVLIGALLGIVLIWGSSEPRGFVGILLLTGAALFLQYLALSRSARETHQLLSRHIFLLEEQLKASPTTPTAEPGAGATRGR